MRNIAAVVNAVALERRIFKVNSICCLFKSTLIDHDVVVFDL